MSDILLGFQGFLSHLGPFLILISVLIFIHELGHFLAAYWSGVHIETFSIGFGPKILKYVKKGKIEGFDTTFCISIIPLGGFVKMYGDNPLEEVPAEYKHLAFTKKNYWQKIFIAGAGPLMNLLFAFIAFFTLAFIGVKEVRPEIGDLKLNSALYTSGARAGDVITEINGQPVASWTQIDKVLRFAKHGDPLNISILIPAKPSIPSQTFKIPTTAIEKKNHSFFTLNKTVGDIAGLNRNSKGAVVASPKGSLAQQLGMPLIAEIQTINSKPVKYYRSLEDKLQKNLNQKTLTLTYRSLVNLHTGETPETQTLEIETQNLTKGSVFQSLGFESAELYIYQASDESPAQLAGIKPLDRLVALAGKPLSSWEDLSVLQKIMVDENAQPKLTWETPEGKRVTKKIKPTYQEVIADGGISKKWLLGIQHFATRSNPDIVLNTYSESLPQAIAYSWQETIDWTKYVCISFWKLVTVQVSPKNLSGIITIGSIASKSFYLGLSEFLKIMAIISINLFILNLIPIPILDGGHILIFTIEAISRRRLSEKLLLVAQYAGLIFLLLILGISLFNDFVRLFA